MKDSFNDYKKKAEAEIVGLKIAAGIGITVGSAGTVFGVAALPRMCCRNLPKLLLKPVTLSVTLFTGKRYELCGKYSNCRAVNRK